MNFGFIGVGAALAIAAIGSAFGAGSAGMSAVGAWKKCYVQNRPAPFMLVAFVGAPLTQTIYGFILMGRLRAAAEAGSADPWLLLTIGVLGGMAMGFSAWFQGRAGAVASDALGETGKGFGNYILVLGLVETVALFVMVFMLGLL
ncbi:V-type ATP synthase subunit K [Salinispira pacifica]|uniref:V-type ATP synthase subunit K n=1 Tax=Salinispira pacifica TaxID=1307761 RepID=V5WJA7_9SPIO|nr:V-type ATP synthase subunit K [Salinispira pacifica]AHC15251.1 V-type ATP synthase subunit K [Salinispira pacifica]